MALPVIEYPVFELPLYSLKKPIHYKAFVVKEEKILLMAAESDDDDFIYNSVRQVLQNCVVDDVDVTTLPIFDLEYLFINLRAKSMGELIELKYKCQNEVEEGKTCKGQMTLVVDLNQVKLNIPPNNDIIKITDKVGMKLRYPTLEIAKILKNNKHDTDVLDDVIKNCTVYIYDGDDVTKVEDVPDADFKTFLNSFSSEHYRKIQNFFYNAPSIKYKGNVTCPKCNKEHTIELEGLLDFFD